MPRGRPPTLVITLSGAEARLYRRIALVWLVARGLPLSTAARLVGINRHAARQWVVRWLADPVAGLKEQPRGNPNLAAARAARKPRTA